MWNILKIKMSLKDVYGLTDESIMCFGWTGNMDAKEDAQEVLKSEKAHEKWHLSVQREKDRLSINCGGRLAKHCCMSFDGK